MKFASLLPLVLALNQGSAFVPQQRAFVRPAVATFMSDEDEPAAPAKSAALVPIKEETVEFTAGILGGAAGFVVGGPVLLPSVPQLPTMSPSRKVRLERSSVLFPRLPSKFTTTWPVSTTSTNF